jgi:hypothetical protein
MVMRPLNPIRGEKAEKTFVHDTNYDDHKTIKRNERIIPFCIIT